MDTPDKQHFSVLVVDDNKENLKVVSNFLKAEGYQIALSLNADDAWNVLLENRIDLILLDVMMPGTDGFTLCKKIKQNDLLKEIPVIFLTAKTETSDLVEGFSAGGVDYITKPFQKEELIARVNNHIALANAKQQIIEQSDQIRRINRTKDRLYSVIAHDIKSPFANISMLISTLADGYLEAGSEEYNDIIQSINTSTQETYALLVNLLQWTRSQTGDLELCPEELSVKSLCDQTFRFLGANAVRKEIKLVNSIHQDITIAADPNMMKSIFHNLIGNAIKFTNNKGMVEVSASKNEDKVSILFRDTGVGISEENIRKLFVDEGQVTTRGTADEKGSGLGLLLVKEFVKLNNGTIDVNSRVGEGTTFTLVFPEKQ
ncbi:MAG: hybrid sensor histidine kinase/response regulator [Bacteroidales bacterium]|nr:hybrid sensor histidine kinase/response regulator [Bacteroidales bacterium]